MYLFTILTTRENTVYLLLLTELHNNNVEKKKKGEKIKFKYFFTVPVYRYFLPIIVLIRQVGKGGNKKYGTYTRLQLARRRTGKIHLIYDVKSPNGRGKYIITL